MYLNVGANLGLDHRIPPPSSSLEVKLEDEHYRRSSARQADTPTLTMMLSHPDDERSDITLAPLTGNDYAYTLPVYFLALRRLYQVVPASCLGTTTCSLTSDWLYLSPVLSVVLFFITD